MNSLIVDEYKFKVLFFEKKLICINQKQFMEAD